MGSLGGVLNDVGRLLLIIDLATAISLGCLVGILACVVVLFLRRK